MLGALVHIYKKTKKYGGAIVPTKRVVEIKTMVLHRVSMRAPVGVLGIWFGFMFVGVMVVTLINNSRFF